MSSPAEIIIPRRRGRPRVAQRLVNVGVNLPPAYLERIYTLANKRDIAVSKIIRHLVITHPSIKKSD